MYLIRVEAEGYLSPSSACRWITLDPSIRGSLYFVFNKMLRPAPLRTIYLTDQNYNDLPISKGVIVLWANHM